MTESHEEGEEEEGQPGVPAVPEEGMQPGVAGMAAVPAVPEEEMQPDVASVPEKEGKVSVPAVPDEVGKPDVAAVAPVPDEEGKLDLAAVAPVPAIASVIWTRAAWKLYISRGLTAFGDRLWAFGIGLLLFKLYPGNLTLVAGFGLVNCATCILLGAAVGGWIDRTERLRAARILLLIQNLGVAIDCAIFALFYGWEDEVLEVWSEARLAVALVTAAVAVLANLASAGSKVVVEKDWVVVISGGSEDNLAKLNTIFRTIDLVCLNVSPILAGLGFSQSYAATAIFMGSWNLVSVMLEYWLLTSIYTQFGSLAKKTASAAGGGLEQPEGLLIRLKAIMAGWSYYFSHPVRSAGLALACLFMTVLGFDSITWGYALSQCVTELWLGLLLAASAAVGIGGSLAFNPLRRALGPARAGQSLAT